MNSQDRGTAETATENHQALVVPAWWLKHRNLFISGLAGPEPGWLAVDQTTIAFAVDDEVVFAQPRSEVAARLRWLERLELTGPAGFHRFHMMRPQHAPRPDGAGATTASDVLSTVVDRCGPGGPGGAIFTGIDLLADSSEFLGGINDYRSGRRNAKLIIELLSI